MGLSKSRQQEDNECNLSRRIGSHFRLPSAAPLHCPIVLPLAPLVLSLAPSLLPLALSVLPLAPPLLPLKRPCSFSRPGRVIPNPKFGDYIIYIYPQPLETYPFRSIPPFFPCTHIQYTKKTENLPLPPPSPTNSEISSRVTLEEIRHPHPNPPPP